MNKKEKNIMKPTIKQSNQNKQITKEPVKDKIKDKVSDLVFIINPNTVIVFHPFWNNVWNFTNNRYVTFD